MTSPSATRSRARLAELCAAAVAVGLILVAASDVARENGAFSYSLDDAYIHLAMAEQFADDLTWGLRPGVVESASSAPGYTAALAAATFLPIDSHHLPLLLNAAAAVALVVIVVRASGAASPLARAGVGVAATFALALVPNAMLGMELLPHAAVAAAFVVVLARHASGQRRRPLWVLAVLAGVLVTLRLESAFLLAGAGLGLVVTGTGPLRSRLRDPLAIAAGGLLSLATMAGLHLAAGQFPLPNSVVAKSRVAEDGDAALLRPLFDPFGALKILGRNVGSNARLMWAVVACALAVLALAGRRTRAAAPEGTAGGAAPEVGACTAAIAVLVAFVGQSWYGFTFTRYGEWLVAAGVVVAALAAAAALTAGRAVLTWGVAVLALALGQLDPSPVIVDAASSVHRQQEQMARFLAEHHPHTSIGVNDLGYVAWLHEGPLVDFLGLGSIDVIRSRREHDGVLPVSEMERIADERGVEIVVVFAAPDKFFPELPASWEPVRDWCLEGSIGIAGDRCVTWFATALGDPDSLRADLLAFEAELPPGIAAQDPEA